MQDEREPNPRPISEELAAFEERLLQFAPAALRVDRDRLMFEAGRAAGLAQNLRPRWLGYLAEPSWLGQRFWQSTTAFATAATILLAATLAWQMRWRGHVNQPQEIAAAVSKTDVEQPTADDNIRFVSRRSSWPWLERAPGGYLGIRYVALTRGVGALDPHVHPAIGGEVEMSLPATTRELLNELLPNATKSSS